MAVFWMWRCKKCGYTVTISGNHEFYQDDACKRKPYGHPVPLSEDAKGHGVKGFFVNYYCPKCREIRDAIIKEFRQSVFDDWWIKAIDCQKSEPLCDKCGARLKESLDESDICPRCNKGIFQYTGMVVS